VGAAVGTGVGLHWQFSVTGVSTIVLQVGVRSSSKKSWHWPPHQMQRLELPVQLKQPVCCEHDGFVVSFLDLPLVATLAGTDGIRVIWLR
jgi:hypothetical protein